MVRTDRRILLLALSFIAGSAACRDPGPRELAARKQARVEGEVLFGADWNDIGLIDEDNDWSHVPDIVGYLGELPTTTTEGLDPATIVNDFNTVQVYANLAGDVSIPGSRGGVGEWDELGDPTIALRGNLAADAPNLVISVHTTGRQSIVVTYNVRDIDPTVDAVQRVALQYRIGASGNFTNLPAGFVADATDGPGLKGRVTPISVTLPADADDQPLVQIRIITANAVGTDEWVGIDDILVFGGGTPASTDPTGTGDPVSATAGSPCLLTVGVTPGTNPTSTGLSVTADLSFLGGQAAQAFVDDGTGGDVVAGDNVFSYTSLVSPSALGESLLLVTIADAENRHSMTSIHVDVAPPSSSPPLLSAAAADPETVAAGGAVILSVVVTYGQNPTSTGLVVSADLSSIGGAPDQIFTREGDLFYTETTVAADAPVGPRSIPIAVSDLQGRSGSATIALTVGTRPLTTIAAIQGSGAVSTLVGLEVRTAGIVTGRKADGGFFIQSRAEDDDGDPATSEGLFVAATDPAVDAQPGDLVEVTGTVAETVPAGRLLSSRTELVGAAVTLLASGQPLPPDVRLQPSDTDAADPVTTRASLERHESMRVSVDSLLVVAPTTGSAFHGVLPGVPRPFREPGIEFGRPLPGGAPSGIPRFDENPERLRVDGEGLAGGSRIVVAAGQTVTNLVGPLEDSSNGYSILLGPGPVGVLGSISPRAVNAPSVDQLTVGSASLELGSDGAAVSVLVRDIMSSPDVVALDEAAGLAAIADRVNADATGAGQPDPGYVAAAGFLVKGNVTVLDVTPAGASSILRARVAGAGGGTQELTVIATHLPERDGVESDPGVRAERLAQAEVLADLVQARQAANAAERIVLVGNFNAFELSDGYVDVVGSIVGKPAPAGEVVLAGTDRVEPDLVNLIEGAPAEERYTVVSGGDAEALDHVIVTANLAAQVDALEIGRVHADFPASATRVSEHDPLVAYLHFAAPQATATTVTSSPNPSVVGQSVTLTATVTSQGQPVAEGTVTFTEGATVLGSASLAVGVPASIATTALKAGARVITATYAGTGNFSASSGSLTQTVHSAATQTTVTSSLNPSPPGQSVTFTATVTSGDLPVTEGTVSFFAGGAALGSVTLGALGTASVSTSALAEGSRVVTAIYLGTGSYDPSSGSVTQKVVLYRLSVSDASVTEGHVGAVPATFTVSLTPAAPEPVTVVVSVTGVSATAGTDFATFAPTTLTFPANVTTRNVVVSVLADTLSEGDETFTVDLASATNATIQDAQGLGTIVDDDPVPELAITDVAFFEGQVANARLRVTLSRISARTVTVAYATADGVARAGYDYDAVAGVLTFQPGITEQSISVPVRQDGIIETDETFLVNLSSADGATIADGQGLVTIRNDDGGTTGFAIRNVTVREPVKFTSQAVFTVVRTGFASELPATMHYLTEDGSAHASGGDYTAVPPTELVFGPNDTSKTISIPIHADGVVERTETFTVLLYALDGTLSDRATGTILDSTFRIDGFTPTTGKVGTSVTIKGNRLDLVAQVGFTKLHGMAAADFTRSPEGDIVAPVPEGAMTGPIQISDSTGNFVYVTDDVFRMELAITSFSPTSGFVGTPVTITGTALSAVSNVRFNGVSALITFASEATILVTVPPGATTGPITVTTPEGTVTTASPFTVTVSNPPPDVVVDNAVIVEGNSGTRNVAVTVRLSNVSATTVSIAYATADETARAGYDYDAVSGVLTFRPGITGQSILVPIRGEGIIETDETFFVNLSSADGARIADGQGIVTIRNDDGGTTGFAIRNVTVREPVKFTSQAIFTVVRTGFASELPATLEYVTHDGTAHASAGDYTAVPPTELVFGPDDTSKTISIPIHADNEVERAEKFGVELHNPGVATPIGRADCTILDSTFRIDSFTPTTGRVGTSVTIKGNRLDLVAQVAFANTPLDSKLNGTVAADFTLSPDGDIVATVPAGAMTGPIRISDATGNFVYVSDDLFHVAPAITSFSPTSGMVGTPVTITGSALSAVSSVSFNGVNARNFSATETTLLVTVPPGATSGPITVTAPDGVASTPSPFTVTLTNPPPEVVVDDAVITEGNSGTRNVTVSVRLSTVSATAVSITYATADDSARAGSDYTSTSGTLTIQSGVMRSEITVPVSGDTVMEADDGFFVNLTAVTGARFADAQARVTITNDDDVRLSINDIRVAEPETLTGDAVFTVTMTGQSEVPVVIRYQTTAGTADTYRDYTPVPWTELVFAPFETSKTINIEMLADELLEQPETFGVRLAGQFVLDGAGGCTIVDSTFRIDSVSPIRAEVGASVTIHGHALGIADRVVFSYAGTRAATATITRRTATEIDATVPDGAITGPITVVDDTTHLRPASEVFFVQPTITSTSPTNGRVGTSVTIGGTGFYQATVRFNGVAATLRSASSTSLVVTVPTGATTGPITVTTAGGVATGTVFTVDP